VVIDRMRHEETRADGTAYSVLTGREREVLQLVAEGKTTKEVAAGLSMSVRTAESHRREIMRKLKLHNVADLTRYAIREGLVCVDG
jgi:DNA-binding CsgD family transcriptional regulator